MKKLLIVVDYQNDFVKGALGFAGAEKIEDKIVKYIKQFKENGDDVVFTMDTHEDTYLDSEEGRNLPFIHCVKGSEGWQLYGKVKDLSKGYQIFEKPTFPSLELGEFLKDKDYSEIVLVGLVSYICVLSNAVIAKAACPNAHIVVMKDATDALDKEAQEIAFKAMQGLQIEVR